MKPREKEERKKIVAGERKVGPSPFGAPPFRPLIVLGLEGRTLRPPPFGVCCLPRPKMTQINRICFVFFPCFCPVCDFLVLSPPGDPKAAGVSHDSPKSPNVHSSRPSRTPPKFNERTPKRRKNENCGGRGKNKRVNVGRSGGGRSGSGRSRGGVVRVALWRLGCHNSGHSKCTGQFGQNCLG